jgi:riboflavin synthase
MFTGIVEALGSVAGIEDRGDAVRLTVRAPEVLDDACPGDSIAVDGCCLTVADLHDGGFTADVMRQTLRLTTLGRRAVGDRVNLERAVTASTRLGGHLMSGHVDATGPVLAREPSAHWELVEVSLPDGLSRYLVDKGSITVDGISLTVVAVSTTGGDSFTVSLIPETLARTTLGFKQPGDPVNLEVDVIAKYVERLLTHDKDPA